MDFVIPTLNHWPQKISGISSGGSEPLFFTVRSSSVNSSVDYQQLMEADPTGGHIDISLPRPVDATTTTGNVFIVKNIGLQNSVGLRLHAGSSTDGPTTLLPGQWVMYVSDGVSNFIAVSTNVPAPVDLTVPVVTGAYNANPGDFVQGDPTGGSFNVTLPAANTVLPGTVVEAKNKTNSANLVTMIPTGADTIDGNPSFDLAALEHGRFVCDGVSDWMVA